MKMAYTHVTYNKKKHSSSLLIAALFLLIHRIENHLVVRTTVGGDAVLPCGVEATNEELDAVEWTRTDLPPDQYVYFQRNGREFNDNKNPSYEGRTSLFMGEVKKGNVSLKVSRVTSSDEGIYTCNVPEFEKEVTVQLIVGERVPDKSPDSGSTEGERVPDSHNGSTAELSPVGTFPWWGGLIIVALVIIIIVSVLLVLKSRSNANGRRIFNIANPADAKDRSVV